MIENSIEKVKFEKPNRKRIPFVGFFSSWAHKSDYEWV